MELNPVIENLFYWYDKVKYRKKMKELEENWYVWQAISESEFKMWVRLILISIEDYFTSVMNWIRFILSPKK